MNVNGAAMRWQNPNEPLSFVVWNGEILKFLHSFFGLILIKGEHVNEVERLKDIIEMLKCCENCDACKGGDREEAGCYEDCAIIYKETAREGRINLWRNKEYEGKKTL